MAKSVNRNPKLRCALAIASQYLDDMAHVRQVTRLAGLLFDAFQPLHGLCSTERDLLLCAALLHDIGISGGFAGHHKKSQKLILEANLPALTSKEREIVANVARYHRKAAPVLDHKSFRSLSPEAQGTVRKLAAILRVADGFDRAHEDAVSDVSVCPGPVSDEWAITVRGKGNLQYAIAGAQRKSALFESTFGVRLLFEIGERLDKGAKL